MKLPQVISPYSKIHNILLYSYLPKIINVATDINLFETLLDEQLTLESIIKKLKTNKTVTEALLKVLVEIELVKFENEKYSTTELSKEYLIKNSELNQLHEIKQYSGSKGPFDFLQKALNNESPEFNGSIWSSKETAIAMEQGAKAGAIQNVVSFIKTLPKFKSCKSMCDFAGNTGYYSYALLQENPDLYSNVYDLLAVCEIAKEVKKEEKDFSKVNYHDYDIKKDESFGQGYDLFFSSHFLYELAANNTLIDFLKKVNKSMTLGGIFVSNHICTQHITKETSITLSIIELQTRTMGYPTHQLPQEKLRIALTEAGFGDFHTKLPDGSHAYSTLIFSAKKLYEIT